MIPRTAPIRPHLAPSSRARTTRRSISLSRSARRATSTARSSQAQSASVRPGSCHTVLEPRPIRAHAYADDTTRKGPAALAGALDPDDDKSSGEPETTTHDDHNPHNDREPASQLDVGDGASQETANTADIAHENAHSRSTPHQPMSNYARSVRQRRKRHRPPFSRNWSSRTTCLHRDALPLVPPKRRADSDQRLEPLLAPLYRHTWRIVKPGYSRHRLHPACPNRTPHSNTTRSHSPAPNT